MLIFNLILYSYTPNFALYFVRLFLKLLQYISASTKHQLQLHTIEL